MQEQTENVAESIKSHAYHAADNQHILVKKYLAQHSLVESNIISFNNFVDIRIQEIVNEVSESLPQEDIEIKLGRVRLKEPCLTEADGSVRRILPAEARLRSLTYSAPITLDISIKQDNHTEQQEVEIGKIPVIVKSKYCNLTRTSETKNSEKGREIETYNDPLDTGGYFIINGNERVMVMIEDLAPNQFFIEKSRAEKLMLRLFSQRGAYRIPTMIDEASDGIINVSFSRFRNIPVIAMLKVLGMLKDAEIAKYIGEECDALIVNLYEFSNIQSQQDAMMFIAEKTAMQGTKKEVMDRIRDRIDQYFLPHVGTKQEDREKKAITLCKLVKQFLNAKSNPDTITDKDHYANKRVRLSGDLLADLFRVNLAALVRDIQHNLQRTARRKKTYSIKTLAKSTLFSHRIESSIATGSWIGERTGVTQNMDKTNCLAILSQLQRVSSLLPGEQENFLARTLHPTHYGRFCVDKDTNVLLDDSITQVPIKDIASRWHIESVLTIDKDKAKFVPSKLSAYQRFNPLRPTIKIETEAGRNLIATIDHPILTIDNKWKDAGELKKGERVAIYPVLESVDDSCEEKIIINENLVKKFYPHNATKIIKKLKILNLFPLTTKHPRLPIIARIFGFLLTDGYVGKCHTEFYCGAKEDMENLKEDIKRLCISPGKEKFENGEFVSYKGKTQRRIFTLQHRAELRPLMILLGIPIGRKTDIKFRLPQWLFESSKLVQREFLAGFLGGDGPKPRYVIEKGEIGKVSKVHLDNLIFHKRKDLVKNGREYANDLKKLFANFDIKIVQIREKQGYKRMDGETTKKIEIKFSTAQENLLKLTNVIGYRYCLEKQKACAYIGEYLRVRRKFINEREKLKEKIIAFSGIYDAREIAKNLNIKTKFIQSVLERKDKFKRTFRPKSELSIHLWLKSAINKFNGIVWEKITNIEPIECKDVRDFTTRENTHSFIANGFVTHNCPIETPEGTEIGLRKNLALLARISTVVELDETEFLKFLESSGLQSYEKEQEAKQDARKTCDVFYNGQFVGYVVEAEKFVSAVRESRRQGKLPAESSVRHDAASSLVVISSEIGRVLRPLVIVKNGISMLRQEHLEMLKNNAITWNDLLKQGVIEYLDASEEENALVALMPEELTAEHTHLEVDKIDLLGLVTSLVPYGNHNQASRLNRGSKTQKQALGLYAANFLCRIDTDVSLLHYPQKPIVRSFVYDTLNIYPAGQNVVVAILTYEGYNLEDAVVINKASIERGLGRSTYFRPYKTTELHYTGGLSDEICVPGKDISGYRTEASYRFLEDDGIAYPEANLQENDVVIGKTSPPKFLSEAGEIAIKARKESSLAIRQEEKGTIDAVFVTVDDEGNRIIQVRTRDERVPELGDKFSTAHGQKGVIGAIVAEEDMPFSARGVKPDIIFNPHGVPSRMTVGYLLEMLAGKVGCLAGKSIDGTMFSGTTIDELENELQNAGFRYDSKETLFNGITGEMYKVKIYIGNMYYLKLKYMVSNKMHARASGKVTLLTRQPIEGRSKGGALRLGEMEQQALVAHGSSLLLKERYDSDKVIVYVCTKCGVMAIKDNIHNKIYCPICQTSPVEPVQISYAFKLLMDELISLHILPRFELKNKYE